MTLRQLLPVLVAGLIEREKPGVTGRIVAEARSEPRLSFGKPCARPSNVCTACEHLRFAVAVAERGASCENASPPEPGGGPTGGDEHAEASGCHRNISIDRDGCEPSWQRLGGSVPAGCGLKARV